MSAPTAKLSPHEISILLRGELTPMAAWIGRLTARRLALHIAIIILGTGAFGAAMGWWRAPQQAGYVAIKFPLIILLTAAGNALVNGMLAPLLGLNVPFRQSFAAIIMSFTVTAAILGAFSPLMAFMVWNAPNLSTWTFSAFTYDSIMLANVAMIALAGVAGNLRLVQLLERLGGSRAVALRVQFAWLAGNLLLGSQLSWILRPFIGSPNLPVEFLRQTAFRGNFFEGVLNALEQLLRFN